MQRRNQNKGSSARNLHEWHRKKPELWPGSQELWTMGGCVYLVQVTPRSPYAHLHEIVLFPKYLWPSTQTVDLLRVHLLHKHLLRAAFFCATISYAPLSSAQASPTRRFPLRKHLLGTPFFCAKVLSQLRSRSPPSRGKFAAIFETSTLLPCNPLLDAMYAPPLLLRSPYMLR